ncbi:MAG: BglII/BstYI family type II restriction endonuclease [Vulcanimicrobiaceae bacterium]
MRIAAKYSHLNGHEYLLVHKPHLWDEIVSVVQACDAEKHRTKVSKERRMMGKLLYSPADMNKAIKAGFDALGWEDRRVTYYVTDDERLTREIMPLSKDEQKARIVVAGKIPFYSYNQTDFVKERCMVEVQFGKYAFIAHDLFVKHMAFYTTDIMDVGIEVLPMKALQTQMSSDVPYYEGALFDLIREGRGVPHVSLVLIGVEPDAPIDPALLAEKAAAEETAIDAGAHLGEDQ